jgi:methionyl-tRNA synthetase
VPVPWDDAQVFYVWFDALLNYYSALTYAHGRDLVPRFWPPAVHVMAKDILKFHAVFWPALLMAAGIELPRRLFVHGYLLMDEEKMSKSLGNVIDPFEVIELYGTDALRYYLLREVAFGQDGSVSPEGFETRYTTELANEYGNLASRTLAMVERYRDGRVPDAEPAAALQREFGDVADRVAARFDAVEVTAALDELWALVRALNRYVQEEAPWQLARDPDQAERLDQVLYTLVEGLRVVSILLLPFMPTATEALLAALGSSDRSLESARLGAAPGGAGVAALAPLFPRVERAVASPAA